MGCSPYKFNSFDRREKRQNMHYGSLFVGQKPNHQLSIHHCVRTLLVHIYRAAHGLCLTSLPAYIIMGLPAFPCHWSTCSIWVSRFKSLEHACMLHSDIAPNNCLQGYHATYIWAWLNRNKIDIYAYWSAACCVPPDITSTLSRPAPIIGDLYT
jgi:hypothetical protein